MSICTHIRLYLGLAASSAACVPRAQDSVDYSQERRYAKACTVPALELNYHKVFDAFPKGEDMRQRLCFSFQAERSQDFDKVRQAFCQTEPPVIRSLKDLQDQLGLGIPSATHNQLGQSPGWAPIPQLETLNTRPR